MDSQAAKRRLGAVERDISISALVIQRQRTVLAILERDGPERLAAQARSLLGVLLDAQALRIAERDKLLVILANE